MVTIDSVNVDALVARYLLPSAPDALVGEVRRHLEESDVGEPHVFPAHGERAGNAHAAGPLPERSPWQVLHVASSAPPDVVEVAYRFWRKSHRPALDAAPDAVSDAALATPAPPASEPSSNGRAAAVAAAHQPCVDADDRMSALGVREGVAPPEERSASGDAAAFIESVSGEHRFGVGSEPLRIGVDAGCDVRVPDSAADVDARIWLHGDRYMLHVAGGGVLVNSASASWAVLDDGDILEIGDATFRFRREQA